MLGNDETALQFIERCENAYFYTSSYSISSSSTTKKILYNIYNYEYATEWNTHGYYCYYEKSLGSSPIYTSSKGSATGTIVESYDQSAYPQDGVQGGYWYTYSHSYDYVFDNR